MVTIGPDKDNSALVHGALSAMKAIYEPACPECKSKEVYFAEWPVCQKVMWQCDDCCHSFNWFVPLKPWQLTAFKILKAISDISEVELSKIAYCSNKLNMLRSVQFDSHGDAYKAGRYLGEIIGELDSKRLIPSEEIAKMESDSFIEAAAITKRFFPRHRDAPIVSGHTSLEKSTSVHLPPLWQGNIPVNGVTPVPSPHLGLGKSLLSGPGTVQTIADMHDWTFIGGRDRFKRQVTKEDELVMSIQHPLFAKDEKKAANDAAGREVNCFKRPRQTVLAERKKKKQARKNQRKNK